MASTTAMYTGLSGLIANARNLDVIGNNIANVNTTAFKSTRMLFESQFSRSLNLGSAPGTISGGTDPTQIGLGVAIAGTQRNFSSGSLSNTGDQRDLAIQGDGFFIVSSGNQQFYTRAGSFRQNSLNDLTTITGERVMGYTVDNQFNLATGALVPLNIPIGQTQLAEATTQVTLQGNLNAGGAVSTTGSQTQTNAFLTAVAVGAVPAGSPIVSTNLATAIDDPTQAGSQALYAVGDSIRLHGVQKGGATLPDATLPITATTTVQDIQDFFVASMGIQPGAGPGTPGVTITAAGEYLVVGNGGTANGLSLTLANIQHLDSTNTLVTASPYTIAKSAAADGESVRTTFVTYDSLGNAVNVDATLVLENKATNGGTTWHYYIESDDNTTGGLQVANGTVQFDSTGTLIPPSAPITATINRANIGSNQPLTFDLDFNHVSSLNNAGASTLAATYQNGASYGVLAGFSVGNDGTITGSFTNGLTRTIGQVVLAKFSNPEGLVDVGSNLFATGPNSGTAVVTAPESLGAGRVVGGALELSNVDLAQEFINLIQASTGYSASSRVITTTDQLMQQLLALGR